MTKLNIIFNTCKKINGGVKYFYLYLNNSISNQLSLRKMIARIWNGEVQRTKRNEFYEYIKQTGLPGLKNTKGNLGVQILIKDCDSLCQFMIISFWDSEESIKNFTGPDHNKARLYPNDHKYLISMEPIAHYEVLVK